MPQQKQAPADKSSSDRANANADFIAQLERLTGRPSKSRDIADSVKGLSEQAAQKRLKRRSLKNALLAGLLAASGLQYYFIDVQLQILSQPTLTVFVPVQGGAPWHPSGG
jgi:hypothetical protein